MASERVEFLNDFARTKHTGRTTHVWDVEVSNESSGKLIALSRCTQMILQGRS